MVDKGSLYIVATPIGNLQDITLRAIETLTNVDIVVCEDTRVTGKLLNHLGIKKKMIAVNDFNEEQKTYEILNLLEDNSVALVSDAGTPLISDPGFRIVREAKKRGYKLIPIPGPSALIAALSVSGLPTDKFSFLGFLPQSPIKVQRLFDSVKNLEQTVILYESPHRINHTVEAIHKHFGDIEITIARELTKVFEEIETKKVSEFLDIYKTKAPKGEFVILFSTKPIKLTL